MKQVWFDMDGTIADLYGVKNWLPMLQNEIVEPYKVAKPLLNMSALARQLNKMIKNGWKVGVISWTARNGSDNYNSQVAQAKRDWLAKHLKSVKFSNIDIVNYGTPKQENRQGILFDDEINNRINWNGVSYNEKNIIKNLKALA